MAPEAWALGAAASLVRSAWEKQELRRSKERKAF
jgi:hypothetical protein